MSLYPTQSSINAIYQMGKPLKKRLSDRQQAAIAMKEHAQEVAKQIASFTTRHRWKNKVR